MEQALLRDDDIAATFAGMSISSDHSGEAGGSKARRRRARNSDSRTMIVPAYSDYYGEPFVWTIVSLFSEFHGYATDWTNASTAARASTTTKLDGSLPRLISTTP